MKKTINKRKIIVSVITVFIVIVLYMRVSLFFQGYYPASENAVKTLGHPSEGVSVTDNSKTIVYSPNESEIGFIFYPGGLVEAEAYTPLMNQLAEHGIKCIVIKMPHYLAFFDANGARGIRDKYPEIKHWYIGGHSLGGAMASMYGARHADEYEGLVFLAAYATDDLTDKDIKALLVRGDQDKVLNMDKYKDSLKNLPKDYEEYVIKGGCHAYFGDYGPQDGDGTPTITVEEQTKLTAEKLVDFME